MQVKRSRVLYVMSVARNSHVTNKPKADDFLFLPGLPNIPASHGVA